MLNWVLSVVGWFDGALSGQIRANLPLDSRWAETKCQEIKEKINDAKYRAMHPLGPPLMRAVTISKETPGQER